jgi:hypothetical protein
MKFSQAVSEEKICYISTNQKQKLPVVAMFVNGLGQNEQKNLCRGPPIDTFYQVTAHWTKRFQRGRFLEIDHSETRITCGGHVS